MVVTDYTPEVVSDEPPLVTETGPWCLISNNEDSVAMSRVQMLANVDGSNLFEVVTTDGVNLVGVRNIRFGRGRSASSGNFQEIDTGSGSQEVLANPNNPWVLITNQGDTIAMSRVSLLASADAADKFEIVTDANSQLTIDNTIINYDTQGVNCPIVKKGEGTLFLTSVSLPRIRTQWP